MGRWDRGWTACPENPAGSLRAAGEAQGGVQTAGEASGSLGDRSKKLTADHPSRCAWEAGHWVLKVDGCSPRLEARPGVGQRRWVQRPEELPGRTARYLARLGSRSYGWESSPEVGLQAQSVLFPTHFHRQEEHCPQPRGVVRLLRKARPAVRNSDQSVRLEAASPTGGPWANLRRLWSGCSGSSSLDGLLNFLNAL